MASGTSEAVPSPSLPLSITPQFQSQATEAESIGNDLPSMGGDSPLSACGELQFGELGARFGHPNFGCGRLNVAENGRPIPTDRVFVAYRHFNSATETDIFSDPVQGTNNAATLDLHRVIFGFEQRLFNSNTSFELRVPFNSQITPEVNVSQIRTAPLPADPVLNNVPIDMTTFEIGNIDLAFKTLLYENCNWAVSCGFGLNLPTGRDVTLSGTITDSDYPVRLDDGSIVVIPIDIQIEAMIANETVYIVPFLGAAYSRGDYFGQGFLQVDTPLSETRGTLAVGGTTAGNPALIDGVPLAIAESTDLGWQTLLRLNAQVGKWIYKNPQARGLQMSRLGLMFEAHYTTTLNDAETSSFQVTTIAGQDVDLALGNQANRVDVVNLAAAASIRFGKSEILPTFVVPVTDGDNKPFDYEVSVLFNRFF